MNEQSGDRAEAPQREMPRYKCHKEVWALKIKAIEQAPSTGAAVYPSGDWLLVPEEAGYGPVRVGHADYVLKHKPEAGGYYVVYDDGYKSYSPAKAFEEGYTPVDAQRPPTEFELAAVSTAPRVTPADLDANIAAEYSFTADTATKGCPQMPSLALLTICILVLKNGFTVIGTSACASPENFDAAIGHRIARDDAIRQVWPLMGYALRSRLEPNGEPIAIYTFDQFIEYGKGRVAANTVNGVPWSFSFWGRPVTHENDNLYLIGNGQAFHRGQTIRIDRDGAVTIVSPS